MNRKLGTGAVAGVAALALAIGGSTLSAPTSAADAGGNTVRAGVLRLDLGADGSAEATLGFAGLMPGETRTRLLWVAANDVSSSVPATIAMTVDRVHDSGALAQVLAFDVRYAADGPGCRVSGDANSALADTGQGNLVRSLGRTVPLRTPGGRGPIVLAPGHGVCVAVGVTWPGRATRAGLPSDNAVEGDVVSAVVRFDLSQVPG